MKILNNLFKDVKFWAIIFFILASVFRIFFIDLIEFKYDEAYTLFELFQFYQHPYVMQVGPPQSTGVYNFPLFNFLMILISLFSQNPLYLSLIIALINSLLVVLFYLVIRKFYSNFVAVIAAFFLAFSPWGIIFSRKIWMPDLILLFLIPCLYFLHRFIFQKDNKIIPQLFIFLALLIQIHASGMFFVIATLIILLILKQKINLKSALKGLGIGFIPAIPYFSRQIFSTPFCVDCQALFKYQGIQLPFDFANFTRPWEIITGLNFEVLLGNDYASFLQTLPQKEITALLFFTQGAVIVLSLILIIRYQRKYFFLPLYFIIIPLLYLVSRTPSYMHYFIAISPLSILVFALCFEFLWKLCQNKKQAVFFRPIIITVLVLLLLNNLLFNITLFNYISTKQEIDGDYGIVYPKTKAFVEGETNKYITAPYYLELKSYSYMFSNPKLIHPKLGDYFIKKGDFDLAIDEFIQSLIINNQDFYSRANLAFLYINKKDFKEAQIQIDQLKPQNATIAAYLSALLIKTQNNK